MEPVLSSNPVARVMAAIATPFKGEDLAVDIEALAGHARWLLANGCDGIVLFGTTGEANSLSVAERKAALAGLIGAGVAAGRIVVGTGCCSAAETIELSADAAQRGCAAVLMLPPFYYKNLDGEGVKRHFDRVIAGLGAGGPPIWLYHIPQVSTCPLPPDLVGRLIDAHGETIAGYKDSFGDFANTAELLRRFPHLDVYVGSETQLLACLRAGGAGCVSATTNVQPQASGRLAAAWRGAGAEALQADITRLRDTMSAYGQLVSPVKALLAEIHGAAGWRTTRPPLLPMAEAERDKLIGEMREMGLEALALAAA